MQTLSTWIATDGPLAEEHAVGWVVRITKALEPVHSIGKAHGRLSTAALVMDGVSCHEAGAIVGGYCWRD